MQLRCPDCGTGLDSARYEGEQIAFCAGCGGILLSRDRLAKIARIRETVIPRDLPTPPKRPVEARRACPRCKRQMRKAKVGNLRPTTVDLCEDCVVLWLDRGEMDNIQLDYEMAGDNRARNQGASPPGTVAADPGPVVAAAAAFQCPKCAHPQTRGITCTRCGIVFEKYEALQRERLERESRDSAATGRMDETFGRITGFEVQQKYHLAEALVGFERANRYALQPVPASATGGHWQVEEANRSGFSILGRNLFGTLYAFTMHVLDEGRNRVLQVERKARLYFYHLDVYDETGRCIGHARRRFSFFDRVITVHDDDGRELLRITGPYFRPWTFLVSRSGADAGSIVKQWSGSLKELYTDADRYSVRFAADVDARAKRLLLGALLLIDSLYFEGRKPFLRHFFDAPGVQILLVIALLTLLLLNTN